MEPKRILDLRLKANTVRHLIIEALVEAGSGHSAGPLGMADIFAALYFQLMRYDPKRPDWGERDRLVVSNGHICPVLYCTMALAGYFPLEELKTLRKINSRLQGHPHRTTLPGLETTSGPLGEGISQAIGMALARRLAHKDFTVFCVTSDGEHQEGNTWEALMLAAKYKIDNFIVIVDRNRIQIDGDTEAIMPLEPLRAKYEAFNWHVQETDGNDIAAFINAVGEAKKVRGKPAAILAHTVPGKDVSFMENDYTWHGKPPNAEQAKKALAELDAVRRKIEREIADVE